MIVVTSPSPSTKMVTSASSTLSNTNTSPRSTSRIERRVRQALKVQMGLANIDVSIHAPRVGCDPNPLYPHQLYARFNSRTPCGVRRLGDDKAHNSTAGFNSRTPCGVRPKMSKGYSWDLLVSIHAPRVGCDMFGHLGATAPTGFNSRTPCGVRPPSHEL